MKSLIASEYLTPMTALTCLKPRTLNRNSPASGVKWTSCASIRRTRFSSWPGICSIGSLRLLMTCCSLMKSARHAVHRAFSNQSNIHEIEPMIYTSLGTQCSNAEHKVMKHSFNPPLLYHGIPVHQRPSLSGRAGVQLLLSSPPIKTNYKKAHHPIYIWHKFHASVACLINAST